MPHLVTFDFAGPDRLGQFGEEIDVLTDNIGSTSGPGGTTFLTGENGKVIVHPQYQPEVARLRSKTTEAKFSGMNGEGEDGIRDTDIASESLIDDMMTGIRALGGTAGPGGTTFLTGENGKVIVHPQYQPEADGLIQRGDTYQEKAQLMQHAPKESEYRPESQVNPVGVGYTEVEWTYFADNLGGTAGPGGSTFLTVENGKVIVHPQYQPEADGLIQRGDTYQEKAQLMQHAPKESEYRPESQVNPVGVGYTEVEWTYFADNLSGTAGPGGSTFLTGYAEAVGLDSSTVDVINKLAGSAGPGCDDI